jgi:hypothetical protein
MKAMRFQDFRDVVGQGFITMKTHNFPAQGWCKKTVKNVIYIWAKPETPIMKMADIEESSGKAVRFSIVHQSIMKHTDI